MIRTITVQTAKIALKRVKTLERIICAHVLDDSSFVTLTCPCSTSEATSDSVRPVCEVSGSAAEDCFPPVPAFESVFILSDELILFSPIFACQIQFELSTAAKPAADI